MSSTRQLVFASPAGVQRLEAAKVEQNLSYAAIAESAGVSAKTVSRLFRGEGVLVASVTAIALKLYHLRYSRSAGRSPSQNPV